MAAQASAGLPTRLLPHVYKPGENGLQKRSKRFLELHAKLTAELGSDLDAVGNAMLTQAVSLLCRAERPDIGPNDAVRCSNAGVRLLDRIKRGVREREDNKPLPHVVGL
jgi:hypothetical protein